MQHPNIGGIKEASGDIAYATQTARFLSDEFQMFCGNDDITVPLMSLGGSGVISVWANIMPAACHQMVADYLAGRCQQALDALKADNEDIRTGIHIVRKALTAPLKQIAVNAGLDGAVVVDNVLKMKGAADGYDAETNQYCDLLKAGVVDPAKVVRTALENAASITGTVLLTETLVADAPEKEAAHAPAMPGMGGMGGMM